MLKDRHFDLIVADAMASVSSSELFVQALAVQRPEACARVVLGVTGNGEPPEPVPDFGVRRTRKPFSLRDLNALAEEIFASNPPRSRAATEGR
jgi:hypothetical protein